MIRDILFALFMMAMIIFASIVLIDTAGAHEKSGFTHLPKEGSGMIIGERHCPGTASIVWFQDLDDNGELDTCTDVILVNKTLHIRRRLPIDGECACP